MIDKVRRISSQQGQAVSYYDEDNKLLVYVMVSSGQFHVLLGQGIVWLPLAILEDLKRWEYPKE